MKASYGAKVDLAYGRYVFNIGGNKYRLICRIDFTRHGVLALWVGTHNLSTNYGPRAGNCFGRSEGGDRDEHRQAAPDRNRV